MPLTFALKDPSDMFAKLHHEHERIEQEVTSYDLFNFVVTAYHLKAWVKNDPVVPQAAKDDLKSSIWRTSISLSVATSRTQTSTSS